MTPIFEALTRYGPVTVERHRGQWCSGVLVQLPARIQESYIVQYGADLQESLKELLKNAYTEKEKLWKIQRSPKQQEMNLNYGTSNKTWKEIA